jgi:hypothetical protein
VWDNAWLLKWKKKQKFCQREKMERLRANISWNYKESPIPSCASELVHRFHWFIFSLDTHWLAWYSNYCMGVSSWFFTVTDIWRFYDFVSHGAGFGGSLLMAYVRPVMYVGPFMPCIINLPVLNFQFQSIWPISVGVDFA